MKGNNHYSLRVWDRLTDQNLLEKHQHTLKTEDRNDLVGRFRCSTLFQGHRYVTSNRLRVQSNMTERVALRSSGLSSSMVLDTGRPPVR